MCTNTCPATGGLIQTLKCVTCLSYLQQYHEAARLLQERGLRGDQRFRFIVDEGAGHHEGAWQWRLGGALRFLAQDWYDG
jgi:hypothetical protein